MKTQAGTVLAFARMIYISVLLHESMAGSVGHAAELDERFCASCR